MEKNSKALYSTLKLWCRRKREREEEEEKETRLDGERDDLLRVSPLSFSFEGKKGSGVEEEEEEIIS